MRPPVRMKSKTSGDGGWTGLSRKQPLFFEHEGNWAVRDCDWNLVSAGRGKWEISNMASDRTEQNDLAAKAPATVGQLRS